MREMLRQGLALPQDTSSETRYDGYVFNAEEWPRAPIVLLDREKLQGWRNNRLQRLPVIKDYEGQGLPERPRDLYPNLGILQLDGGSYAKHPELRVHYQQVVHWGVVAMIEGRKAVGTWSTSGVRRKENGTIHAGRGVLSMAVPIEVGTTKHLSQKNEELERVNAALRVHRVGTGERQAKPSPFRVFLGRLAFRESQ
jgi:hypothetical protein